MFITLKRTAIEAIKNFLRNGWLSLATVSILILSLYIVSVLYVVTFTVEGILKNVEDKVSVSIYFKPDVAEVDILKIRDELKKYNEIKAVDYVSRDQALSDFKKSNSNEPVILQSLEEIGENPLMASLVVKTNSSNDYQTVSDYINKSSFSEQVSRINYGRNKDIIDKLSSIIATIRRVGITLGILFAVISILITFNTVRITIYAQRKAIEIMRLVGASNTYIRLPFILEGTFYGLVASIISMIILFATLKFVTPYVSSVVPATNLIEFYFKNFFNIFGIQVGIGVVLGIVSSWIAMRKYLKI